MRGKGLIMLGGFHSFGPGGYFDTPLADVLPVEMDHHGAAEAGRRHPRGRAPARPVADDADAARHCGTSSSRWPPGPRRTTPPGKSCRLLDGANRFRLSKLKPGADVLADADGKEENPLLVTQTYGNGRVIAFAGDSTWRWWMHGFQSAHKRFWRQIVLWLAQKDQERAGQRLGAAGQHPLLPRQSRGVHRRGPVAAERADHRRRDSRSRSSSPTASVRRW